MIMNMCLCIFAVCVLVFLFKHDETSYTDYEITDCRYFVKCSSGLFSSSTYERLDVFYENTKVIVNVSSVEIDAESFVRVYDDTFGTVEVHLTKDDYMLYVDSKGVMNDVY